MTKKKKLIHHKNNGLEIKFFAGYAKGLNAKQTLSLEQEKLFLENSFLAKKVQLLHQVHGNDVIDYDYDTLKSSTNFYTADAHLTTNSDISLGIRIADCVPVTIWSNENKSSKPFVIALHCGWQSIHKNIISKALTKVAKSIQFDKVNYWIGPHIQQNRFEVHQDVFSHFDKKFYLSHQDKTKKYINLKSIIIEQIIDYCKIKNASISHFMPQDSTIDTGSTLHNGYIYSHRLGDKQRNVMLVSLL